MRPSSKVGSIVEDFVVHRQSGCECSSILLFVKLYRRVVDIHGCDTLLLYNRVLQLYIYTHPFFLRFFSHIDDHRLLGRVPCARQQVPTGSSLHKPPCAYASPSPQSIPTPVCPPLGTIGLFSKSVSLFLFCK